MYTIKQVSEILGISKVSLRYYDKVGILKTKRLTNSYRVYDDQDINILKNIIILKQANFSLEDIKILTSLYSFKEGDECNNKAVNVMSENLKSIYSQISFLKQVATTIEEIFPLFQTHDLYKLNQDKLEMSINDLFEEVKKQTGVE